MDSAFPTIRESVFGAGSFFKNLTPNTQHRTPRLFAIVPRGTLHFPSVSIVEFPARATTSRSDLLAVFGHLPYDRAFSRWPGAVLGVRFSGVWEKPDPDPDP